MNGISSPIHKFTRRGDPASWDFVGVKSAATNTSTVAFKLIDSVADFVADGVVAGDFAKNKTADMWAVVVSRDSATQLTLDADIFSFATGHNYLVGEFRTDGVQRSKVLTPPINIPGNAKAVLVEIEIRLASIDSFFRVYERGSANKIVSGTVWSQASSIRNAREILIDIVGGVLEFGYLSSDDSFDLLNMVVKGWWT